MGPKKSGKTGFKKKKVRATAISCPVSVPPMSPPMSPTSPAPSTSSSGQSGPSGVVQGQGPLVPARSFSHELFELNVIDLRASIWDSIPVEQRIQRNMKVQFASSEFRQSFNLIRLKIQSQLQDRSNKEFLITNSDREVINATNFMRLRSGSTLLLLDTRDQPPPFDYQEIFNTAPHSKTVTSQKGAYHDGSGHNNSAGFALAELVDNALSATKGIPNRRIEIKFYDNGNADNSAIHVLDNGHGMTSEALQLGLVYKAPKESRRFNPDEHFTNNDTQLDPVEVDLNEEAHPLHLNSNISKFGAGMKKAVFFLGARVIIMTKTGGNIDVQEIEYSTELLEKNEGTNRDEAWKTPCRHRAVGLARQDHPPQIRDLILNEEPVKRSFTHLVIDKLDKDVYEQLKIKDQPGQKCPSVEKQLAHIYHYYVHGREGNVIQPHQFLVDINVTRVDSRGNRTPTNLGELPPERVDLESQFVRTGAETFRFTVEFTKFTNNVNVDERGGNRFKVGGILRYHPYMYTGETIPGGKPARGSLDDEVSILNEEEECPNSDQEGEAEADQNQNPNPVAGSSRSMRSTTATTTSAAGAPRKCDEFFSIWWNGRLVPSTKFPSLDWCSPGTRSSKLDKLYDRISGSLFFDSHVKEITDNKLNITEMKKLLELFNEKRMHTQQATFQRVMMGSDGNLKAKGKTTIKKEFEAWLKACTIHDRQVQYSDPAFAEDKIVHEQVTYVQYKKATWDKASLKAGDMVRIKDPFLKAPKTPVSATQSESQSPPPPLLGRVVSFLVRIKLVEDSNKLFAPLSLLTIAPRPTAFYTDETLIKQMSLIDVDVIKQDAENLLKIVENELKMKIVIRHELTESDYRLNRDITKFLEPIPIDGTLFDKICLDIVKEDGVTELKGFLPHPYLPHQTRNQAKRIHMSMRIHRINADGKRDLFYTGPVCPHIKNPRGEGYFFKAPPFNLVNMEFMKKPGRFVLTFRSYIDVDTAGKGSGTGRGTPVPESPRRGSRIRRPTIQLHESDDEDGYDRQDPQHLDTAYEIEWEKEVDELGRKILVCDDGTKIRLPYHEIEFSTVAGMATAATLEQIGEEGQVLQIGIPFPIFLSFKDAKENKAMPPQVLADLYQPNKSLVYVGGAGRKPAGPDITALKCSWGNVEPVGDMLVINDVVIKGSLHGLQHKDIKLNVAFRLQKKPLQVDCPTQIRVGKPIKLKALEPAFEVENGERAIILCQALDCSNNVVTTVLEPQDQAEDQEQTNEGQRQHEQDIKPIMLICDFYKEGDSDETQKLLTCTVLSTGTTRSRYPETSEIVDVARIPSIVTPCTLDCILSYKDCETAKVKLHVKPSKLPERLRIYEIIDGSEIEVENESETRRELRAIIPVCFKLFDGLGNEIPYDSTKHKFCFEGWPKKSKVNRPNSAELRIPMKAKTRKVIRTVAEIQLASGGIKSVVHEFYVSTSPGDPVKLEVFVRNQLENTRTNTNTDENADAEENVVAPPMPGRAQIPIDEEFVTCVAHVTDQHGNIIRDGMDMEYISELRMEWDTFTKECEAIPAEEVEGGMDFPGSFLIKFKPPRNPGDIGDKDIQFRLGEFFCTLKVCMMPGKPTGLAFEFDGVLQRRNLTLPTRNMTSTRVRVLLVDAQQNPTNAVEQVEVSIELGNQETWAEQQPSLLRTSVILRPGGNESGIADFGNLVVGAPNGTAPGPCQSRTERCGRPVCFQVRSIKAVVNNMPDLKHAFNKFHIAARSDVLEGIKVDIGGSFFHYRAGSPLDNLKVSLIAEDRMPMMTGVQLQHLTMQISDKNSTSTEVNMTIVQPTSIEGGVFTFDNTVTRAGVYTTKFVYSGPSKSIKKPFDDLVILSGDVASIQPEGKLEHDTVSVSGVDADAQERTIVQNFKLVLRDRFGNLVNDSTRRPNMYNEDLKGSVRVDLLESQDSIGVLRLEQHASIIGRDLTLTNGQITFPALVIEKNQQLRHNSMFKLEFTAVLCNGLKTLNYELRFIVSNCILQLKEIKKLESEYVKVKVDLDEIKEVIKAITDKKDGLEEKRNETERTELEKRTELLHLLKEVEGQASQAEEIVTSLQTAAEIDARVCQLNKQHSLIKWEREGSRTRSGMQTILTTLLPTWDNSDPAVLGQVGRLVEVKSEGGGHVADTKLQTVLSWYLQSDLDTVVVLEEKRGHALNRENTQASFMLLDIISDYPYVHQNWNNTIPEALLQFGHPVFARSLLQLPSEPPERIYNIRKVFGNVLGDTVVVNTLEDATAFMKEYHRLARLGQNPQIRGRCPTVITRNGNRLTAKGVIGGGSRNQAPTPIDQLKHRFGMGPNLDMVRLEREMKLLSELEVLIGDKLNATKNLEDYTEEVRASLEEWEAKFHEVDERKAAIEIQLDIMKRSQPSGVSVSAGGPAGQPAVVTHMSTPQVPQTRSRSRQPDGESTPSPAKRTRHEHDQEP